MKLIVVHQVLIAFAIALAFFFGVRAFVHAARGEGGPLVGATALVVCAGLGFYFHKVRARYVAEEEQRSGLKPGGP